MIRCRISGPWGTRYRLLLVKNGRYKNSREDWIKVSVSETMVTISSFDDKQTIRVGNEFDKERFCCPPSTRSYYQSVAERWWPHLFGPGQLSREEEMVHVQLTPNMAKAFECSALTTAEFHSSPTCNVCANYPVPSEHALSYFVAPHCRAALSRWKNIFPGNWLLLADGQTNL